MTEYFTLAQFDETANAIRARSAQQPAIGLILGSGLGGLADAVERAVHIPYP
ncbi:MAG: purine nucleoside phosphorylase, partial [Chloroflexota bacterium]